MTTTTARPRSPRLAPTTRFTRRAGHAAAVAPVGWAVRPDGSTTYLDSPRHLRVPGDGVFDTRALCGAPIPAPVLAGADGLFAPVQALAGALLAAAVPCPGCHRHPAARASR